MKKPDLDLELPPNLDTDRHPPELMRYFLQHQRDWREGKILLKDFCRRFYTDDGGNLRPLWYAEPMGRNVLVDKAQLYEEIGYRPSLAGCTAHAALAKVKCVSGGARGGKSRWAAMEVLPLLLTPGTMGWIVAPEYTLGEKEFRYIHEAMLHPFIRTHWGPMIENGRISNNVKGGDMEIRLSWGDAGESVCMVKTAKNRDALLGEALDWVIMSEASQLAQVIWSRYIQMRLTTKKGVAIFPSSPQGKDWFDAIVQKGLRGDDGFFTTNIDTRMNPTLDLTEVAFWTSSDQMSDEDFEEQVRGKGTPPHGLVYKTFDLEMHTHTWRREWPKPGWRKGRTFDFGFTHPYVVLWYARDEDGRFYFYREYYKRRVLTDEVIEHIARVEGWPTVRDHQGRLRLSGEPRVEKMTVPGIADWDAGEIEALRQRGLRMRMAKKDVLEGIKAVEHKLRVRDDGRPRLYVSPKCKNLLRELAAYEWDEHGKPKEKQDDHALDAMRYAVYTLDPVLGSTRVRTLFGED